MEEELWDSIVDAVPQWYTAEHGPNETELTVGNLEKSFFSPRGLTPALLRLHGFSQNSVARWLQLFEENRGQDAMLSDVRSSFQQALALKWLRVADNEAYEDVEWPELFAYVRSLRYRTYENEPIPLNLIISPGTGSRKITDENIQKTLDPLLRSPQVYMRVSRDLCFRDYGETRWEGVQDTTGYKLHPEFLQPLASILERGELGVHLTRHGDLIILSKYGLLAAWRKGQWYFYDRRTLKNGLVEAMSGGISPGHTSTAYQVGCNLFEVALNLSYERHGALLVYDPEEKIVEHISNEESILGDSTGRRPGDAQSMLAPSVHDIKMGARQHADRRNRLFEELASMDGAVVFTDDEIVAFGAMIAPNAAAGDYPGARTTAAWSALEWGGRPIKVSEDGDIEVLFHSADADGNTCAAEIRFL